MSRRRRSYLECGMLAYGFVRARCEECGANRAVAFPARSGGFCPCSGRRMADTAARLVDDVMPRVPVRQWVRGWICIDTLETLFKAGIICCGSTRCRWWNWG